RQVWRGPTTLQIGLDARHGTVLDGLTPGDRVLLRDLGSGVDEQDALTAPGRDTVRTREVLRLLTEAEVLIRTRAGRSAVARLGPARDRLPDDARIWSVVHPEAGDGWELLAARSTRRVDVHGGGRLGTALAATLAAAGVGSVPVRDRTPVRSADVAPAGPLPAEVGAGRGAAARSAVQRLDPGTAPGHPLDRSLDLDWSLDHDRVRDPGRDRTRRPDLVVLIDRGVADASRADPLVAADIPHLSVVVAEASVIVGPLVVPGRSPCLRCLDLHRTDNDPQWPRLLGQLLAARGSGRPGGAGPEETASAGLAEALAALQVLGHLDGLHLAALRTGGSYHDGRHPDGRHPDGGHPEGRHPGRRPPDGRGQDVPFPAGRRIGGGTDPTDLPERPGPAALGTTIEVALPDGLTAPRTWTGHPGCGCRWPSAVAGSGPSRSAPSVSGPRRSRREGTMIR
ncbi:MAG: hypothetical protein P8Z68_05695, partial [Kineosporiaceae bacterium]